MGGTTTEMRKGTAKRDATFSDGHWSASITRVTRTYDGARKYAKVKIEESTSPKIQRPDTGFDRPVAKHMSPAAFVIAMEDYARKPQCDCIRVESEQMLHIEWTTTHVEDERDHFFDLGTS